MSDESYQEWADWNSSARWDNIAGLLCIVVALGLAVTALVISRRNKSSDPNPAQGPPNV